MMATKWLQVSKKNSQYVLQHYSTIVSYIYMIVMSTIHTPPFIFISPVVVEHIKFAVCLFICLYRIVTENYCFSQVMQ